MEEDTGPKKKYCKSCGQPLDDDPELMFCPICGFSIQSQDTKTKLKSRPGGIRLGGIGGLLSIGMGLIIPVYFPELFEYGLEEVVYIIMGMCFTGGSISIIGAIYSLSNPKPGWKIILIGGIIGGGNILAIIGASILKREYPSFLQ